MGAEVDQSRERGVCNVPRISQTKTTQPNIKIKWRGVKKKKQNKQKTPKQKSNIRRSAGLSPLQKRPILPRRGARSRRQSSPAAAFPPLPSLQTKLSSRCTSLEMMTWRPPPGKFPEAGELLRIQRRKPIVPQDVKDFFPFLFSFPSKHPQKVRKK